MTHKVPLIFVFLIAFASNALAQSEADSLVHYTLDTLQVEAIRTTISASDAPLSLSIDSRSLRQIDSDAATSLASITRGLPGLSVNNRQNYALGERLTIRGLGWRAAFGVRGVQLVLNGIPITVADGQSITNMIDPEFISRVELIRGPAASYWGNSSGGVLYFSTDPNYGSKPFRLRTQAGSYGQRKVSFQYSQAYDRHQINAFSSYQYTDGYRNYSASKILRSGVQGQYQISDDSRLEYVGAMIYMPQAQHPSGLTAEQRQENPRQAISSFVNSDAGKQITQGQLGLSYYKNTSLGLMTINTYGAYRDLANPLPFGIITVDRLAGGARGTLEESFGNLEINGGVELKLQHDNREEFENVDGERGEITVNQLEEVTNQAIFVTSNYTLGSFHLLGSLRYDNITFSTDSAAISQTPKRSFQAWSPGIGLSYEWGSTLIYSNLNTSFEAPTTTELVNRPDGGNGFNPTLKPEKTVGLELGARGLLKRNLLQYDIALYRLWIDDLLFPYQLEPNGPTFYRNQGQTNHQGIELSASLNPNDEFSVNASYTLTDAQFERGETLEGESLKDKTVPGVAKHRVGGGLQWSPDPVWIRLEGEYVGSYPVNNLNTMQNDGYFVMDAKLSYKKIFAQSGVEIIPFINVNNLLNTSYNGSVVVNASGNRYFEPAPGRNWQAGISMRF